MPRMTAPRPSKPDPLTRAVVILSVIAAVAAFLVPTATLSRAFGGEGAILIHPGRVMDFTGFLPQQLPDFTWVTIFGWVTMLALVGLAALAWVRSPGLTVAGIVVIVLGALMVAAFVRAVDVVQLPLLEAGTAYRRLPFRNFGPNLWPFLVWIAGLAGVIAGLAQNPARAKAFTQYRTALVPALALLLAVVVGGVIILLLQPVPGGEKVSGLAGKWYGGVDLLWFAYSTLFGPVLPRFRPALDFALPLLSLAQSTPLIFTGLALAFAFRTGLFNIGAPGQVLFGGIFAMLVGVYVPGPAIIVAPLAIVAAALGGGFWGAIPGWLKARFGASEVINTIMLNVVASSILIFLLSDSSKFFGRELRLPFKAPGGESKSLELRPESHLELIVNVLGLKTGIDVINFAPWLALLGLLAGLAFWRGALRKRVLPAVIMGAVGLVLGLAFFSHVNVPISSALMSTRLNLSFIVALVAAWLVGVILWRTTLGYELRAVGLSPKAAEYGGVNIARNTILAMAISGALAGLASTHYVLGGALDEYRLKQVIPADSAGFGGITVALLGNNTPNGVVSASILFGVLNVGGLQLAQSLNKVSREVVTVLQALMVLFIAARAFLSSDFFRVVNPEPEPKPSPPPDASASSPPDITDPKARAHLDV
jgi:general nucleoside transport system permease protein